MKRLIISVICLVIVSVINSDAQFYTTGSDSPRVKWMHIKTDHFDVIYPCGQDSLARVYALRLESIAPSRARRVPVLLRTRRSYSNGMVTLPPLRMELQTVPDAYDPLASPWNEHLVIHESDHLRRMTDLSGKFPWKPLGYLFGGLGHGAGLILTTELSLLEGSAVIAETEGTLSGRGRTADFLEYYRVATGSGIERDFYQWRYGSLKNYTPDYYRAGYIAMSGDNYRFRGLPGRKFAAGFRRNLDSLSRSWRLDEAQRGPFPHVELLTDTLKDYEEFTSPVMWNGGLYAIRSGKTHTPGIVSVAEDGSVKSVAGVSSYHSRLSASESSLFWSEYVPDLRWEYRSFSDIFCLDSLSRRHRVTTRQRYYNPSVSPDGIRLSVTSYEEDTSSSVVIINASDGSVIEKHKAPSGMQVTQTAWCGSNLYAGVLSSEGFSICSVPDFSPVLPFEPVKIKDLWSLNGKIFFTCDRTGVNELYELDPANGEVRQCTVSRYGVSDFCLDGDGHLVLSTPLSKGRILAKTDSLLSRKINYAEVVEYPFTTPRSRVARVCADTVSVSVPMSPRRYHKFPFIPHSWAPFYVDYDAIDAQSFYSLSNDVGLGATLFLQNPLGNIYGAAAVHSFRDYSGSWRTAGYINITTTALYPVIEAKLRVNDRQALRYLLCNDSSGSMFLDADYTGSPGANLYLRSYIPFNFSRADKSIGLVPSISASFSNDSFCLADVEGRPYASYEVFSRVHAGVRAYCIQGIPDSRIFPRFGVGAEFGTAFRPCIDDVFRPVVYASLYGYLPGLGRRDGFRLRGIVEKSIGEGALMEIYANTVPRGFSSSMGGSIVAGYVNRCLLSVDYALPFASLDWSGLSPVAYLRNLEFVPHFDVGLYSGARGRASLASAGAEFRLKLGNFLWIPLDTRIGVRYDYNTGSLLDQDSSSGSRHSVELLFSVDL
ncbi:MAG TPA: hypothetical protein DDX33_01865 [Rikenellaceae bacterium]|nr:hypothetical protein [Rikenellaceae bacterium]